MIHNFYGSREYLPPPRCVTFLVPYASVNVKPQGNGAGHTQGDLTFWAILISILYPGGKD